MSELAAYNEHNCIIYIPAKVLVYFSPETKIYRRQNSVCQVVMNKQTPEGLIVQLFREQLFINIYIIFWGSCQ